MVKILEASFDQISRNVSGSQDQYGMGWKSYPSGGGNGLALYAENTIDIRGLTQGEDETLFFGAVNVMESFSPVIITADAAHQYMMTVVDLITDVPLTQDDWGEMYALSTIFETRYPGFLRSNINMENVVYARFRKYQQSSIAGFPLYPEMALSHQNGWGTCQATASSTLYVYKVIMLIGSAGDVELNYGATQYVIACDSMEESTTAYLERLRRSYIEKSARSD